MGHAPQQALGGAVVRRAVVGFVVVMMVVRCGERRRSIREHADEEEELLHSYQNGTNGCRLSVEIQLRIKEATHDTGYCSDKGACGARMRVKSGAQAVFL